MVRGKLEKLARRKIIATITLDVHGRDVVKGLIAEKTEGPEGKYSKATQEQYSCNYR